ncbi:MAG: carboxylating nicotinate-nucleotide diphosphorylase [Bacteroidia bacterium]
MNSLNYLEKYKDEIIEHLQFALREDLRDGDHTTLSTVAPKTIGKANLVSKDSGIWAGNELVKMVIDNFFNDVKYHFNKKDGDELKNGEVIYELEGSTAQILSSERLILNLVQHLSGVASYTHKMASVIKDLNTKLLDTRKTTPGLRILEKWAVKIGGGANHRMGLYDMIMIKDNHIDQCGSITLAVNRVVDYLKQKNLDLKIEVETRNICHVEEVMKLDRVNWVMLDNFTPAQIEQALEIIDKKKITEASGGININNIRSYAETGVDFISSGSLTQRAGALDLSLKIA